MHKLRSFHQKQCSMLMVALVTLLYRFLDFLHYDTWLDVVQASDFLENKLGWVNQDL